MAKPIGIFDSGVGGTSIWKEVAKILPSEKTIYLADSANAPYGEKSKEEILRLSIKNTEYLLGQGCKIVLVACNTATTNAIDYLRSHYAVPFIGIEPAIKPAALHTKTKKVGVLATKGTLSSSLFHNTSKLFAEGITVLEQEGKGLVEFIEAGKIQSKEMKTLLQGFLQPMLDQNIDCLVLGCTHYPYLMPVLKDILPEHINIIDSGEAVARQTKAVLEQHKLLSDFDGDPVHVFYTNAEVKVLKELIDSPTAQVSYLDF
ncbi:Glutamate racemase [Allomuricauda ruestringensis DSM 13258]|uniref:Glutamate racemase n=1 Tax=Allomuricauda ruestringensis (strain DSM 13258 / CIP 107369 / LMG 19739 / B1) TaxID=886377 RepID=G2PKE9_ALLRU|nr:glutamate racemase [Allomuricauda ruestringensis]AEM70968.1 Glutamate racemase [Allomuricauda ruestringensis DSM 13258]